MLRDEIRAHGSDNSPSALPVRHWLAVVEFARGNFDAAEAELSAVAAVRRTDQTRNHQRWTRATRYWLARIHHARGELDAAETELRSVLDDEIRANGSIDHPVVLDTRHWLAVVLRDRGEHAAAESDLRDVLVSRAQQFGDHHPDTVRTRQVLNHLLDRQDAT